MASTSEPKRVIYSPEAREDLAHNYEYTTHHWGEEQAEKYAVFLVEAAQKVATNPQAGKRVLGYQSVFAALVRWKNARYGHNIVYREIENGIYVLRVLHSAMDVPRHLKEDL